MRLSRLLGLMAATALVVSPVAAQAQASPRAATSQAFGTVGKPVRAGAPMQQVNRGEGNMTWLIVGGVVAAGVLLWLILDDDDDDAAASN